MLEVSGVSRHYGDLLAVDGVSFTIDSAGIVGLLGHNSAGKTTIMKMLSGYLEPDAGSIRFNDLDLQASVKTVQRYLGYLPESLPVYAELTVLDYLDYVARLKGLDGDIRRQEIRRVVRDTDIGHKALDQIMTLSRGYRQRVGVAQALLARPQLLILDEPTNGLDPTQTEHMRDLIRDIAHNATVILSTHIMQEVEALCDRVLILSRGQLVVDEKLQNLRRSNQLVVACSIPADKAIPLFSNVSGVSRVVSVNVMSPDAQAPSHRFTLTLADDVAVNEVSAEVSRMILRQDGELHELRPLQRDLETLFREVSRATGSWLPGEGVRDAA